MATIRPFKGVRYNPDKIDDLSAVISQPYDRVRHGLQDKYYAQSRYSIVRIIKGKEQAGDDEKNNVYTRARDYFNAWLQQGILMREDRPALYILHQTVTLPDGSKHTRQGMIAAFELARFDEGIVLPHERTLSGPKVDRLNLLRTTEVNFGHIFMLYPGNHINDLARSCPCSPCYENQSPSLIRQIVWFSPDSEILDVFDDFLYSFPVNQMYQVSI